MSTLDITIEEGSYNTIVQVQPTLAVIIGQLLDKGQSPRQIARSIEGRDVFLAGIAEMAAVHMLKSGVRPATTPTPDS
jgi:hypothetical protein